jgi:hypothetical protein
MTLYFCYTVMIKPHIYTHCLLQWKLFIVLIRSHMPTHTHVHAHTHRHTCFSTHTHTCTHTERHTHTNTHTQTQAHAQLQFVLFDATLKKRTTVWLVIKWRENDLKGFSI